MYADRGCTKQDAVPNIVSVVATRAIEKLVIIAQEDKTMRTFKFPEFYDKVNILANIKRIKSPYVIKCIPCGRILNGHAIVKHKSLQVELDILNKINVIMTDGIVPCPIKINDVILFKSRKRGEIYESVIHLYQKVIMQIVKYEITKDKSVLYYLPETDKHIRDYIVQIFKGELIKESIKIKSQYLLRQINNFNWINLDYIMTCVNMIMGIISPLAHSQRYSKKNGEDIIKCKLKYIYDNIGYIFNFTANNNETCDNETILYSALCLAISDLSCITIILIPNGKRHEIRLKSDCKQDIIKLLMHENNTINANIYEILNNIVII
jgi:ribosomal protein S27E